MRNNWILAGVVTTLLCGMASAQTPGYVPTASIEESCWRVRGDLSGAGDTSRSSLTSLMGRSSEAKTPYLQAFTGWTLAMGAERYASIDPVL